jgi:hypothetical protein
MPAVLAVKMLLPRHHPLELGGLNLRKLPAQESLHVPATDGQIDAGHVLADIEAATFVIAGTQTASSQNQPEQLGFGSFPETGDTGPYGYMALPQS